MKTKYILLLVLILASLIFLAGGMNVGLRPDKVNWSKLISGEAALADGRYLIIDTSRQRGPEASVWAVATLSISHPTDPHVDFGRIRLADFRRDGSVNVEITDGPRRLVDLSSGRIAGLEYLENNLRLKNIDKNAKSVSFYYVIWSGASTQ